MCLIIKANNPKELDLNLMECAYQNNSDGFGVMFYNRGKVHKIGRAHVRTPVTRGSRMPSSA